MAVNDMAGFGPSERWPRLFPKPPFARGMPPAAAPSDFRFGSGYEPPNTPHQFRPADGEGTWPLAFFSGLSPGLQSLSNQSRQFSLSFLAPRVPSDSITASTSTTSSSSSSGGIDLGTIEYPPTTLNLQFSAGGSCYHVGDSSSSSSSKRKKKKREKKKNKDGNASYEGDKEQQHAGESSGGDNFASIERMVEEGNDEKEGDNEQDSDNDNDETNAGGGGDDDSAVHSADSCDWRTESDEDGEDEDEQKRQQHRRRCSSFHAIMRSAFCAKTDDEAAAPTYDDGACPSIVGTLGCGDGRKRLGKETPRRGGNAGSGGMSKAIAGDNGWRFVSSDDNVDGIDNDHTADKDGGDLDADAVSALGLELDMLLLGPQALALALSPSQVEALGKFLANRIAAVQDARVLQARVAAMNEARNALGISS
mmetsp:Transcript_42316/g.71982  ORF Transcript_42316/g.71982 Transcript_42316/m.71982 type:complete len:422 (-) Transcript_42316:199-1464(-)